MVIVGGKSVDYILFNTVLELCKNGSILEMCWESISTFHSSKVYLNVTHMDYIRMKNTQWSPFLHSPSFGKHPLQNIKKKQIDARWFDAKFGDQNS